MTDTQRAGQDRQLDLRGSQTGENGDQNQEVLQTSILLCFGQSYFMPALTVWLLTTLSNSLECVLLSHPDREEILSKPTECPSVGDRQGKGRQALPRHLFMSAHIYALCIQIARETLLREMAGERCEFQDIQNIKNKKIIRNDNKCSHGSAQRIRTAFLGGDLLSISSASTSCCIALCTPNMES